MVAKDVESLEVLILGSVLELDADKVTDIWGRAGDELDDQSGSILWHSRNVGVVLADLSHAEERDEGLVGGSD